uniref:Uncharacterized protein n=1 Tax=Manihot esculenta TaxID=3983 RepID=A0A2C9WFG5_MANES
MQQIKFGQYTLSPTSLIIQLLKLSLQLLNLEPHRKAAFSLLPTSLVAPQTYLSPCTHRLFVEIQTLF